MTGRGNMFLFRSQAGGAKRKMAIQHQVRQKYPTRNHEIIAELRELAGAAAPVDPYMAIKRKTAELAVLMAQVHGGEYRHQIDHEDGSVVVRRRCPPKPT